MSELRSQDMASGNPNQVTSLSLLKRAQSQDAAAWERLMHLYRPLVGFWCRRAGVAGHDLDDVIQEVFVVVYKSLPQFRRDREGDSFRGWLKGVTRYRLLEHFERVRRSPLATGGSTVQDLLLNQLDPNREPDEDEAAEYARLYHRALDLLAGEFEPRSWQMFWRTVVDGLSTQAAAEELGTTPARIRQARSRILRRLKEEIGELVDLG